MKPKNLHRLAWMLGALLVVVLACQGTGSAANSATPTSQANATPTSSPTQAPTLPSGMPPANLPAPALIRREMQDSSSMATAKNVTSGDVFCPRIV